MPAETLTLDECPVYAGIHRASVSFAFEIGSNAAAVRPEQAIRIAAIYAALFGNEPRLSGEKLDRARSLFGPSRSFLDDITTGFPGVNGRPLLLSANTEPAQKIQLLRPETWSYEYENDLVDLRVPAEGRQVPLVFHDHFCLFESGRIFYIAVLSHDDSTPVRLDEYGLLQLQQLAIDPSLANDADYLRFRRDEVDTSLTGLVGGRFKQLQTDAAARDGNANALRDVLLSFGVIENPGQFLPPNPLRLCSAMFQIEHNPLFQAARHAAGAINLTDLPEEGAAQSLPSPAWLSESEKAWHARYITGSSASSTPHDARAFSATDEPAPRQLLAMAGLAQGVPDFPRQDESEIHDSTRPVAVSLENLFYTHPAFDLSLGINWRTFREGQETVGACPYALLTWAIAFHDELIVTDLERMIEEMIFGKVDDQAPVAQIGKAEPLTDIRDLMKRASRWLKGHSRIIDENLRVRVDIFRWCSIHQSGNVFRYQTERDVLSAIREARGTQQRFDDAHAMLDRYEGLVEDVASLSAAYTSARTNWLLAAIAVLQLLSLPKIIQEGVDSFGLNSGTFGVLALVPLLLLLFVAWNRRFQPKEPRKPR